VRVAGRPTTYPARVPSKTLAIALSAVLGIVAGVIGSFVIPRAGATYADPQGHNVPLVNQRCTGKSLILVGWGPAAPPLSAAVNANGSGVHYLDTHKSCPTAWRYQPAHEAKARPDPTWVAYLGPFASREAACQVRMSAEHKGDFVTRLNQGNTDMVQCACYYDVSAMPTLTPGMDQSVTDGIWIRQLQQMLLDIGALDKNAAIDGFYGVGSPTVLAVVAEKKARTLSHDGVVDEGTWRAITQSACSHYTS
jgi:hypothetical protein